MAAAGSGIFFNGVTSARRPVRVELSLRWRHRARREERDMLVRWPYGELTISQRPKACCARPHRSKSLARLEVRDPALAAAIEKPQCRSIAAVRRSGAAGSR